MALFKLIWGSSTCYQKKSNIAQCIPGCQVFGQEILPNFFATVLWDSTVAKKSYLLKATLGHKKSLIRNALFTSAETKKVSNVAKSCEFWDIINSIIHFYNKKILVSMMGLELANLHIWRQCSATGQLVISMEDGLKVREQILLFTYFKPKSWVTPWS